MKIINIPRQSGKTTTIIKEMLKTKNDVMVVFSQMSKELIVKDNPTLKNRVLTIDECREINRLRGFRKIHIDNLNECLGIFGEVGIVTMTNYPVKGEFEI